MEKSLAALEVRVNGRPLKEYPHDGNLWIEGRKGSEFTIRVRNRSDQRIMAVVSVDGLSVMSGKPASSADNGYIVEGNSYVDIPGWRLDDEAVAKFKFAKGGKGKTYAEKSGEPQNIGVIGCAVFPEMVYATTGWTTWEVSGTSIGNPRGARRSVLRGAGGQSRTNDCYYQSSHTAAPVGEVSCYNSTAEVELDMAMEPSLGTEFGKEAEHKVRGVSFTPDKAVMEMFELRYADRAELKRRGVSLDRRPRAFPKDTGCKPPAGWSG